MVKYLVTGGCGFIGSHLVDLLVKNGDEVRVIDDLSNGSTAFLPREVEFINGSMSDEALLHQAIQNVQGIFHLAARVSVPESIEHWLKNHLINCAATVRLFELSKKIPIILASSSAVYGDQPVMPQQENATPQPLSPYAVDKLCCEYHARLGWQLFQTPSISFRFFNVYGPRQNPHSPYSGVISKFALQLAQGHSLTIFGDGSQERDFIYVKDIVNILYATMRRGFKGASVYNLCTGVGTSINRLAEIMCDIAQIPAKKEYLPPRQGEIQISIGDPREIERRYSLKAQTDLKSGLGELMRDKFLKTL